MKAYNTNNISRENILHEIERILQPWMKDTQSFVPIHENTHIINDLSLDSIGILQVISEIEDTFDIVIENHELDMEVLSNLANLINLIETKLHENN